MFRNRTLATQPMILVKTWIVFFEVIALKEKSNTCYHFLLIYILPYKNGLWVLIYFYKTTNNIILYNQEEISFADDSSVNDIFIRTMNFYIITVDWSVSGKGVCISFHI